MMERRGKGENRGEKGKKGEWWRGGGIENRTDKGGGMKGKKRNKEKKERGWSGKRREEDINKFV